MPNTRGKATTLIETEILGTGSQFIRTPKMRFPLNMPASKAIAENQLEEVINTSKHLDNHAHNAEPGPVSIKEMLERLDGVFPFDEAVVEALPKGIRFVSVKHFGTSAFTITGRVVALDTAGKEQLFFLKVAYGEHGRIMLNGEWESSNMIYDLMPDFIPQPIGFGQYRSEGPATYFYLSRFVEMNEKTAPDPENWARRLATMHRSSKSPTGKFGFPVKTCDGKVAHTVDWNEDWAEFFKILLLGVCKLDRETNGPWPELERASAQVATKVIPRLLGNLRTPEGGKIKPSIIHGDLWEGNMGIHKETGDTILFDAGSYFAHNEMELGHWRVEFTHVFRDQVYTEHYLRHFPAAEPAEQFDDRNRLYSLKASVNYSAGHPGSSLRKTAYNNMCYLCEKYAPLEGIDKYDPAIDPSVTGARIVPHVEGVS
ncbi:Fructosamine kinase-domain-containing protein [Xylariomycetidae sp. FL0641]|nr:Fructosamine kinase-domain-containing protein [Xylariomycetidae sp. FL0641]